MSYLKTKPTNEDIQAFLDGLENATKKTDSKVLLKLFTEVTTKEPQLWGNGMIGFGTYTYTTKAGKVGEWFLTGFSPRKTNLSLHLMYGLEEQHELLAKLGKHKIGKGCLYINKLADVNLEVLTELIKVTFKHMQQNVKS